jgi:hypothetical protein
MRPYIAIHVEKLTVSLVFHREPPLPLTQSPTSPRRQTVAAESLRFTCNVCPVLDLVVGLLVPVVSVTSSYSTLGSDTFKMVITFTMYNQHHRMNTEKYSSKTKRFEGANSRGYDVLTRFIDPRATLRS